MPDSPLSPAAREKARVDRAERAMERLLADFGELCGRPEDVDALTVSIYEAARRADVEPDDALERPSWHEAADQALANMTKDIPQSAKRRVLAEAFRREMEDPDARRCLAWSDAFFAPRRLAVDSHMRLRLAALLLDYAFDQAQRSGQTDALVRAAPANVGVRSEGMEVRSLAMLGRTVRWGGTVLAAIGIFMSGQMWLIPMVLVAWLVSWMLIDKRALKVAEKRDALAPSRAKQEMIVDSVKDAAGRRRLAETVSRRCPEEVYRGFTTVVRLSAHPYDDAFDDVAED